MKYVPLALLTFAAIGCRHNEFDVSPVQVSHHSDVSRPAAADPFRLAPGAKTTFKKGDKLPDGTIADGDMKISSDGR